MTSTYSLSDVILENEGLIYKIINKYTYYFDKDDLYQVAVLGLIMAYKNFNQDKNTKFSSYAYFYIDGEVKKYIRESNYFKVSKELVKLNNRVEQTKEVLTNKLGKVPTDEEISIFIGVSYNQIEEARCANNLVESLDNDNNDVRSIYEKYGEVPIGYDASILDLKEEISKLDEESKMLLKQRYENGLTQNEVSELLGFSQVQISRKEKDILKRLRKQLS